MVNDHFPGQITRLAKCAKEIMQLEKYSPLASCSFYPVILHYCVWLDQPLLPAINHLCLAIVCLELGKGHPLPPPIPDSGKLPTLLVERTIIQSHALFSNCFCIFNEVISYLGNNDGSKFSRVHPGHVLRLEKGRAEPAF